MITVSQKFDCQAATLWNAITDPVEMRKWYFDNFPDFKAKVGFTTRFNVKAPSRDFLHIWTVTKVDPGKSITYTWEFEGITGKGSTEFRITEDGDSCTLELINLGRESFPQEYPEFSRESALGGWEYFIQQQLPQYISGLAE